MDGMWQATDVSGNSITVNSPARYRANVIDPMGECISRHKFNIKCETNSSSFSLKINGIAVGNNKIPNEFCPSTNYNFAIEACAPTISWFADGVEIPFCNGMETCNFNG